MDSISFFCQYIDLNGDKFVSNCKKLCKTGGIGMYAKNCIDFNMSSELTVMHERICRFILMDIKVKSLDKFCGTL